MGFNFKSKSTKAVRGGGGHMVGKQHVGPKKAGAMVTKSGSGGKFASGGKTKMFGKQSAMPAKSC
jgi:hypothetical protein